MTRFIIIALLLCNSFSGAQSQTGKPCSAVDLVGTWRVISVNGQTWPAQSPVHKHLTQTHFVLVEWNPKKNNAVTRVHAGPYTVKNGKYTEEIAYGLGASYEQLRASSDRVELGCRIEGDQWHINGYISGNPLSEIWVRVGSTNSGGRDH
jgi:hypothetical protein